MACIILVLTDLQLGFKRKSSEGVGDSSIDMSVGNVSRRLKVLNSDVRARLGLAWPEQGLTKSKPKP